MNEVKANYGVDHVREWTEMKPHRKEGCTSEGFPLSWEKLVPISELEIPRESFESGQIGMVGDIIIPEGWATGDGNLRIIQKPK